MTTAAITDTTSWRKSLDHLDVTYVWAYDTSAILDDYNDSHDGIFPKSFLLKPSEVTEDGHHVLCDVADHGLLERTCLPKNRVMRYRPWCWATPLQIVLTLEDFQKRTEETVKPGRLNWLAAQILGLNTKAYSTRQHAAAAIDF